MSSSAPKVIGKGASKRKIDGKDNRLSGKDNRLSKKASVTPGNKQPKKSSPPKSSHETGKGLMTSSSPIT